MNHAAAAICQCTGALSMSQGNHRRRLAPNLLYFLVRAQTILKRSDVTFCPSGFPQRNFALLENKTFSKGLIALKYKRLRSESARKR
jgi:hypothetical protein